MATTQSVRDIAERIEELVGTGRVSFLDLTENSDEPVEIALAELADSDQGGALMVLGDEDLVNDDGECWLDRLELLFPILETSTVRTWEGWLWAAVVVGTGGVPEKCGNANDVLRMAERAPLMDADLNELDLSALVKRKVNFEAIRASSVLKAIRDGKTKSLWKMGLATIREDRVVPTVAGMVALGRHPYRHLPGMCVELDIYGERVCWRGSLRELEARANGVTSPYLQPAKTKFREILMNAILHRGWRQSDWRTPIRISVSDGALELTHPGRLNDWRVGKSTPVNPKLFGLARWLKLANGTGAGLQMVETYLIKREFRPLEFAVTGEAVQLSVSWPFLPRNRPPQSEPAGGHAVGSLSSRAAPSAAPVVQPLARDESRWPGEPVPPLKQAPHPEALNSGDLTGASRTPNRSAQLSPQEAARAAVREAREAVSAYTAPRQTQPSVAHYPAQPPAPYHSFWPQQPGGVTWPVPIAGPQAPTFQVNPTWYQQAAAPQSAGTSQGAASLANAPQPFNVVAGNGGSLGPIAPPRPLPPIQPALPGASHPGVAPIRAEPQHSHAAPTPQPRPMQAPNAVTANKVAVPIAQPPERARSMPPAGEAAPAPASGTRTSAATLPTRQPHTEMATTIHGARSVAPIAERMPPAQRSARSEQPAHAGESNRQRAGTVIAPRQPGIEPKPRVIAQEAGPANSIQDSKERAVVELLRRRGPMTTQQIMQALNWTRWAARTALERLIETNRVRPAAASPRSPLQTYELV